MLKSGDEVILHYYQGEDQVKSLDWIVKEYDNGLLKVYSPSINSKAIFNLRSIGFLMVELID